jgi:hypothetical protein
MLPGETKSVKVMPRHKKGIITARAYYSRHVAEVNTRIEV